MRLLRGFLGMAFRVVSSFFGFLVVVFDGDVLFCRILAVFG